MLERPYLIRHHLWFTPIGGDIDSLMILWDMLIGDDYYYNHFVAVGNYYYPRGLDKYYDMAHPSGYFSFLMDSYFLKALDWMKIFTFFVPLDTWWSVVRVIFDESVQVGDWRAILLYLFVPWGADWFGNLGIPLTATGIRMG